jgi:Xaa-Pro aminopeptidase
MLDTGSYAARLAKARALMHTHALDYLVVGPSADLLYLLGARNHPSERLALLLVPQEGPAHMVLPAFEAPVLPSLPSDVHVTTWGESDNPARIAATLIASGVSSHPGGAQLTIGVSDRIWAVFLLRLQAELPRAAFTTASHVLSALRLLKSEAEIALLKESGRRADEVFTEIIGRPFAGRTELAIAQEIAELLKDRGLALDHPPIVGSGPNSASPHHQPGERVIKPGDAVVLDFGGTLEGYYSDITRTVFVGEAPQAGSEEARVYELVAAAQDAAVRAARPGMPCEALDAVARDIITEARYGDYFNHRLGHGIGLDGHEPPYLVRGNSQVLQPGMAFSIEPGVYLPGKFGVRVEDSVVLRQDGAERFNNVTREMVVVG